MSDTTITAEERARLRSVLSEHGNPQVEDRIILRLLNTVEQAESNVARLTKERDWLAKALAEDGCPYLALWSDFGSEMRPDWCICIDTADDGFDCNGDPKECWKKEAARKAVEGK